MTTTRYVFTPDGMKNKETGEVVKYDPAAPATLPMMIIHDLEAHMAPRGYYVSSRSKLKDLEHRHGVVPYERVGDMVGAPTTAFSRKDERWQEFLTSKSEMVAKRAGLDPKSAAIERELRGELATHKAKILAKSKKKTSGV